MKTQAIIPTAGSGTRMQTDILKPLVKVNDKPIFIHTLQAFENSSLVDSVILVVPAEQLAEFEIIIQSYDIKKVSKIVAGGRSRCDSVNNALKVIDKDAELVLVHDGARPVVTTKMINEAIGVCEENDAVVVAVPLKPTIKRVDIKNLVVKETLNREELWEIQTPQVFKRDILLKAHQKRNGQEPSDDAVLVEALGVKVKILEGDYKNIKITTNEDLLVAETFLNRNGQ